MCKTLQAMRMLLWRIQSRLRLRQLRKVSSHTPQSSSMLKLIKRRERLIKRTLTKEVFSLRMSTSVLMKLSFKSILKSAVKLCAQQSVKTATHSHHSELPTLNLQIKRVGSKPST